MERDVHFVNDSWCFVKFSVNMNNFTISSTREGGFKSKEAADSAKKIADEQYESDLKRIKEICKHSVHISRICRILAEKYFFTDD